MLLINWLLPYLNEGGMFDMMSGDAFHWCRKEKYFNKCDLMKLLTSIFFSAMDSLFFRILSSIIFEVCSRSPRYSDSLRVNTMSGTGMMITCLGNWRRLYSSSFFMGISCASPSYKMIFIIPVACSTIISPRSATMVLLMSGSV